jgi:MFS family permease
MAGLVTNMRNFTGPFRGTIVAVLETAYSLGSTIFIVVYGAFFVNGHTSDEENQDIGGFFLCMAIVGVTVNGLATVFLGHYDTNEIILPDQHDYENLDDVSNDSSDVSNMNMSVSDGVQDVTGIPLIRNWDFQFLFWCFVMSSCEIVVFLTNINVYLKSFSLEEHSTLFNMIVPIFGVIGKLICGSLSDKFIEKIPRTVYMLTALILQVVSFSLCIFLSDSFYVLLFTSVTIGFALGAVWSISAILCSEYFGLKYFGRNWGAFVISNGIFSLLLQKIFGALYDAEISVPGETFCYGPHCFRWNFAVATVLTGCAVLFNVGLIERRRKRGQESS